MPKKQRQLRNICHDSLLNKILELPKFPLTPKSPPFLSRPPLSSHEVLEGRALRLYRRWLAGDYPTDSEVAEIFRRWRTGAGSHSSLAPTYPRKERKYGRNEPRFHGDY